MNEDAEILKAAGAPPETLRIAYALRSFLEALVAEHGDDMEIFRGDRPTGGVTAKQYFASHGATFKLTFSITDGQGEEPVLTGDTATAKNSTPA